MNTEQRIRVLEEEVKILKNEIKTVLLDIREQYLNIQSPFNCAVVLQADSLDKSLVTPFLKQAQVNPGQPNASMATETTGEPNTNTSIPTHNPETGQSATVDSLDTGCVGIETVNEPISATSDSAVEEINTNEACLPVKNSESSRGGKFGEQGQMPTDKPSLTDDSRNRAEESNTATDSTRNCSEKSEFRNRSNGKSDSGVDLSVIAGVAHWVENATSKLGKYRVIALLEVLWAMGRLSTELKDLLVRLADMSPYDKSSLTKITVREYLFHLAQLSELTGDVAPREKAVLSLLSISSEEEKNCTNEEAPVGQDNGHNPSGDGISGVQRGCLQCGVPGGDGR